MTPVATTRIETVSVNAAAPRTAAEGDSLGGVGVEDGVTPVQPEYEVVYRGQMDLAEAWEGPGVDVASARHPKVRPS